MQEQAQQSTQNDNIYNQSHSQKNVTIQKVDKLITPFDLEHSILRPQVDPLVGDIVTRLLQKIKWKLKDADVSKGKGAADAYADEDRQAVQSQSYDQWNEALAKKFAVMYKKYLKFKEHINVETDPNLKWCPSVSCMNYVRRKKTCCCLWSSTAICECKQVMCFKCGAAAHPGSSCNKVGNAELRKYMQENDVVKCPNCGFGTEKIDGCNHMTCAKCSYGWCWICRGKYRSGHFSDWNIFGCPGG